MSEYGFLIPVYNHGKSAYEETRVLLQYGLRIILVDDGSDEESVHWLRRAQALSPLVTLERLPENRGKGVALMHGFQRASELSLDYLLQIDADGQHDIDRVPFFLQLSRENPGYAIVGYPEYDDSAPRSRSKGRNVANFFLHLTTFDFRTVKDSMCGFRVYPVKPVRALTRRGYWDKRMAFDIEILVKMYWKQVPMLSESVKVTYPEGSLSNFHMVKDNIRISWVFTRLCICCLFHLPSILHMHAFYSKEREGK